MRQRSQSPGSAYFYYPRLVCVIGARDDEKATANFAPVTWATPLSCEPPLFGACVSPSTRTHHLVLKTGEFTLSFLGMAEASLVDTLGRLSGSQVDKVKALELVLEPGEVATTPSLAAAYARAECILVDRHQCGDQTLLVGELQRVRVAAEAYDVQGVLRLDRISPLLYLGGNRYVTTDPTSESRPESRGDR